MDWRLVANEKTLSDVLKLAGETVVKLQRAGISPTIYESSSSHGCMKLEGWKLHYLGDKGRPKAASGSRFARGWEHRELVLATDGKIYEYRECHFVRSPRARSKEKRVLKLASQTLLAHLDKSKPYVKIISRLRRLPSILR
jgi:hypothetical protein